MPTKLTFLPNSFVTLFVLIEYGNVSKKEAVLITLILSRDHVDMSLCQEVLSTRKCMR